MKKPRLRSTAAITLQCHHANRDFPNEILVNGHALTPSEVRKISSWLRRAAAWKTERDAEKGERDVS